MNGPARQIEIFAPFNQAMELTRSILFRPFDIGKWLVIGFAAFLSGWFNSGGGGVNPWSFRDWHRFNGRPTFDYSSFNVEHPGPFLVGLIAALVIFGVALVVLWIWITCRGRFIFIDCIVRNRAAITEPWHEYRHEGNRFFLFAFILVLASAVIMVLSAALFVVPLAFWQSHHHSHAPLLFVFLPVAIFCWIAFAIVINLITYFMAPVMYARRCSPTEAARALFHLILDEPAPFVLFILFMIVLWIGWIVLGCLITCATCCLAALPYLGTVIVLPVPVLFRSFSLLFLRQFGPEWDVWSGVPTIPTATVATPGETAMPPTAEAPPIVDTPPSAEPSRSPYEPPDSPPPQPPQ